MIRLAVAGDETVWRGVSPRLRGAVVESCFDAAQIQSPPDECDAVMFVDAGCPPTTLIADCLSGGKHVLLAAGSWLSLDVLETLSGAAKLRSVRCAIVNPDRILPSRQLIRQQLDAGKLGEPGLVRVHRWEPAAITADSQSTRNGPSLVREFDLTLWLIGRMPNVVFAVERAAGGDDHAIGWFVQVHIGFEGGGMALIDATNGLPPGDGYQSLSVIGSAGAAYADDHQNVQLVYRGGHPLAVRTDERTVQLAGIAQSFVDDLIAGREDSAGVTAWRNALAVADAVQSSIALRQAVRTAGEDH